ncbi:methyl-accepting chemotaxis protein [Labrenzia sp. EL_208]|uniref:Methyl-accepting chemotaxis protein 4 n=1 Tax=Roseibium album TaxID=311410 RepID=A0A0M7AAY0_9HYPH|nr:methyl-accepting chemotaxis protein [Roseibium album]MBG6159808.1 methyl-accepting chemotaxis protein [Labrenzia sp. EL_162]MBG6165699.1 methyl-accepting chemotaxis protein [Labrenzia sp. EL_195]MBG6176574.1 methyl-accepting chemotaxis protein [Labrenzia sp. EL_132]MBG6198340.1 methyl-accepting chemotaxis protein [Labrenzia sp. EL_159]MBG6201960.1 methyl-accepting chemotaxis protein [Labrenzia sp. EL_13]MBG6210196.1 methyl-accepting chemotaxis protein [Labrenzia sp. EL_126]MBG6230956.1 me
MFNVKIGGRIYAGCFALVAVLVVSVVTTLVSVRQIETNVQRLDGLRIPTSNSSQSMVRDIYGTLAALRGWMLTGNPDFKVEREAVWQNIAQLRGKIDELSTNWTNPENVDSWNAFKVVLDEFAEAQNQVEALAKSPDQFPATKILIEEAAPLAASMVADITKMIDIEGNLPPASDEHQRKKLLGMMADVRGTLGLSLANIRAFLLTGDKDFQANFETLWVKNSKRFEDLTGSKDQLKPDQLEAFERFLASRENFAPLPAKMFGIRGSERWDAANYALKHEAAPRAGKLLTTLVGAKDDNGIRGGGMVDNQRALMTQDAENIAASVDSLTRLVWGLLGLGLVLGVAVSYLTARSIVRPVTGMTGAMARLAENDISTEVPSVARRDEIGEMAKAVQVFKENMIRAATLEQEQQNAALEAEAEKKRMMEDLANDFERAVGSIINSVSGASTELQTTAQSMTSTVEQTSMQAGVVATSSDQANSNVQTVAAATEEMAASVQEIGRQAEDSSRKAQAASAEAEETVEKVGALSEAATKIGAVVSLIQDIAEQTNLLALNATIEAARAGEAGRGFAIVASEVKDLASQTASATTDIGEQINAIQDSTQTSAEAIGKVTSAISDLNEIAASIAAAVEEQSAATSEIAGNVQQAAVASQEVSDSIGEVNQSAAGSSAAAAQVLSSAGDLSRQSESLRNEVDRFLQGIRVA